MKKRAADVSNVEQHDASGGRRRQQKSSRGQHYMRAEDGKNSGGQPTNSHEWYVVACGSIAARTGRTSGIAIKGNIREVCRRFGYGRVQKVYSQGISSAVIPPRLSPALPALAQPPRPASVPPTSRYERSRPTKLNKVEQTLLP